MTNINILEKVIEVSYYALREEYDLEKTISELEKIINEKANELLKQSGDEQTQENFNHMFKAVKQLVFTTFEQVSKVKLDK